VNPVKKVGFWYSTHEPELLKPKPGTPMMHKSLVLDAIDYVEKEARCVAYRGFSCCRICGRINGSEEFTFKGFTWPSGYKHYIEDHNVYPDPDWLAMVIKHYTTKQPPQPILPRKA